MPCSGCGKVRHAGLLWALHNPAALEPQHNTPQGLKCRPLRFMSWRNMHTLPLRRAGLHKHLFCSAGHAWAPAACDLECDACQCDAHAQQSVCAIRAQEPGTGGAHRGHCLARARPFASLCHCLKCMHSFSWSRIQAAGLSTKLPCLGFVVLTLPSDTHVSHPYQQSGFLFTPFTPPARSSGTELGCSLCLCACVCAHVCAGGQVSAAHTFFFHLCASLEALHFACCTPHTLPPACFACSTQHTLRAPRRRVWALVDSCTESNRARTKIMTAHL